MFALASTFSRTVSVAAMAFICAANTPVQSAATDITGLAKVIDGDTLQINDKKIRIHGVEAPEKQQTCQWPTKTVPCGSIS